MLRFESYVYVDGIGGASFSYITQSDLDLNFIDCSMSSFDAALVIPDLSVYAGLQVPDSYTGGYTINDEVAFPGLDCGPRKYLLFSAGS